MDKNNTSARNPQILHEKKSKQPLQNDFSFLIVKYSAYFCSVLELHDMRLFHSLFVFACLMVCVHVSAQPARMQESASQTGRGSSMSSRSGGYDQENTSSGQATSKEEYALRIKAVRIDEVLGEKRPVDVDTLPLNFQNNSFPERMATVAASYLANIGSPFQSKIYTDRLEEERFIFLQPYDQWKASVSEWAFYNTTRPYTNGTYFTTVGDDFSQEENFRFYFTANVNKYLNVGADYEAMNARGYYKNLSSRHKTAHIFGNYQSPTYEAFVRFSYNRFENNENGGITNDDYITKPLEMSGGYREYESQNIPVSMSNTFNMLSYRDFFLNHKYFIGFNRPEIQEGDTTDVFVPVTSLIHTFHIDNSRKNYDSNTANTSYYDTTYINNGNTADTAALTTVRNTLGISLREGFHSWAKFGLTAYAEHEYRKYAHISPSESLENNNQEAALREIAYHKENLLWLGARIQSTQDSLIQFDADGRICMVGDQYVGNFELGGNVRSHFRLWSHSVNVSGTAFVKSYTPDYFMRSYYSNHFRWQNHFSTVYKTRIAGRLEIPRLGFDFSAGVENISNYVYFNQAAIPAQYNAQLQVLFAEWKQHIGLGLLNFDYDVVGQLSGQERILPLPALSVYGNLYLNPKLFNLLTMQIGVDCRYHTAYYAPAYMPATNQYHLQEEVKIGNYPFMNVYANFHLKRARFFILYAHASRLFATPNYFTALHYPANPASIKAGISWNFYD